MDILAQINVKDCMVRDVFSISIDGTVAEAYQKMQAHLIRHLPVLDSEKRVVGIFSDRDLNHAYSPKETASGWYYPKDELELLVLKHFMTREPVTLAPEATLKEAIRIFVEDKIGVIPVVDSEKRLLGIISYVDVLKKIATLL